MAELTDAMIDQALVSGRMARQNEPRAVAARYDAQADRITIDLANGCTFTFPPHLAQGLQSASPQALAHVEILGQGYGLHWEVLDVDLSIPGLLSGLFGTASHMARIAGQRTSPAKAQASRNNGGKGGRPRKAVG